MAPDAEDASKYQLADHSAWVGKLFQTCNLEANINYPTTALGPENRPRPAKYKQQSITRPQRLSWEIGLDLRDTSK